ncbi:hypothetical protein ACOMHN_054394 [Nucella lapillus]
MKTTALLTALGLVAIAGCSTLPPVKTVQPGCMYQGTWYPEGSFQPNPCSPCHCQGGRAVCAVVDCFLPPCVDHVYQPDHCCPPCPNGPNCQAPGGQVIKAGETVQINSDTTCTCPSGHHMGFMGPGQALCRTALSEPVTMVALS